MCIYGDSLAVGYRSNKQPKGVGNSVKWELFWPSVLSLCVFDAVQVIS